MNLGDSKTLMLLQFMAIHYFYSVDQFFLLYTHDINLSNRGELNELEE